MSILVTGNVTQEVILIATKVTGEKFRMMNPGAGFEALRW